LRVSRKWLIILLALVASVALASAATYEWFLRISTPVRYSDSMQFWYTDETLNGQWVDIGINKTTMRPSADLTKGVLMSKCS